MTDSVLVRNTQALYLVAEQLAENGTLLTILNLAAVIGGVLLAIFIIADWSRSRWDNVVPAYLIIVGLVGMVAGYLLLGIVGTPIGFQTFAVMGDDTTQFILAESKRISTVLAGLSVVGLTSGILYVTLAGVAIWKNRRLKRRKHLGGVTEGATG